MVERTWFSLWRRTSRSFFQRQLTCWAIIEKSRLQKPNRNPHVQFRNQYQNRRLNDLADAFEPLPFWRQEGYEALVSLEDIERVQEIEEGLAETVPAAEAPEHQPLSTWRVLGPRLRQRAAARVDGHALDVKKIIGRLSRGDKLQRLPRKQRLSWGRSLHVIRDRSLRLVPYWRDQDLVLQWLRRLLPANAVHKADFFDGLDRPIVDDGSDFDVTEPGALVLVLGDLGCLAREGQRLKRHWAALSEEVRDVGGRPIALSPAAPTLWSGELKHCWEIVHWDGLASTRAKSDAERRRQAERLLALISPAVRVEPSLLRAIRSLLDPNEADAGTEADVWQHGALIGRSSEAGTVDPARAETFRRRFAQERAALRERVLVLIRAWHDKLPDEIWDEELISLDQRSKTLESVKAQLPAAHDRIRKFESKVTSGDQYHFETVESLDWFRRVSVRVPDHVWADPALQGPLSRLWHAAHRDEADPKPPGGFLPGAISSEDDNEKHSFAVIQRGKQLDLVRQSSEMPAAISGAGLLARLLSRNRLVMIKPLDFWKSGEAPSWAATWGEDSIGPWVTFEMSEENGTVISQRMRWIPAGKFLMGSPEDEPERREDEGPQHEVTITKGYWLFDTPCTQALWQAVMGENPSSFKDERRPVESISHEEASAFIKRLNDRLPGLGLSLPTEAQWEYACRAGTKTPFSFGGTITTDQANFDGNYPYVDGATGEYRDETVPVASLPPNFWGLYEMHGNVWEWCQDSPRDYGTEPVVDPAGPTDDTQRVLRGGSWHVRRAVPALGQARRGRAGLPEPQLSVSAVPEFRRGRSPPEAVRAESGAEAQTAGGQATGSSSLSKARTDKDGSQKRPQPS